jgi:type IV pilus assembly protein PilN
MFEGLKKKLSELKSKKAENNSSDKKTSNKKGLKELFNKVFGEKISQMSVAGEEIAGLDISKESITVAQVSKNNDDKWILDKISYRLLDKEKINEDILESKDYISEEIKLALANAKITTTNVAISVPVTSAIIRVVTSPLMTEEELTKAIETDSLWENLVQLTDNLNDYSIFHQVINRNSKTNTMEILFVASKLSDVNSYTSMIKKAGLNPVIMDVKCFTLKNAFDNSVLTADKSNSAILEVGLDDNYLMIIHDNTPIITDVFLRQQEKQSILNIKEIMSDSDEGANVIRRYAMQIKQALNDYEGKYQTKINNIKVVSSLGNIKDIINLFRKNLPNTGILLFDPLNETSVPAQNKEKVEIENKSIFTSVMGLAFRKLDVFGYYKFVTAVKNINLLPNRDSLKRQNRMKFISGFAFKGLAAGIAGLYILLTVFSFIEINSNKKKLANFDQVQTEFDLINTEHNKLMKTNNEMRKSLQLGQLINSNQIISYKVLAQITRSVPIRVQFTKLNFNGVDEVIIEGTAFADQDIINFISNLNQKPSIDQASLVKMNVPDQQTQSSSNTKGFTIMCKLLGDKA